MDYIMSQCAIIAELNSRLDTVVRTDVDFEFHQRLFFALLADAEAAGLLLTDFERSVVACSSNCVERLAVERLERGADNHFRNRIRRLVDEGALRERFGAIIILIIRQRNDVVDIRHVEWAAILDEEIGLSAVIENVANRIELGRAAGYASAEDTFMIATAHTPARALVRLLGR